MTLYISTAHPHYRRTRGAHRRVTRWGTAKEWLRTVAGKSGER